MGEYGAMTRKISDQRDEDDAIDAVFTDRTRQVEDENDEVEEILSSIDQSDDDVTFSISVSRHTGTRSGGAWCFDCTPAEFKTVRERLLIEHGPGTYLARVKRNGKFFTKKIIEIDKPNMTPRAAPASQVTDIANAIKSGQDQILNALAGKSPANGDTTTMIFQMMQLQSQQSMELIKALLTRDTPQPKGLGEDLKVVATILELAKQVGGEPRERGLIDIVERVLTSPAAEKIGESLANAIPPQIQSQQTAAIAANPAQDSQGDRKPSRPANQSAAGAGVSHPALAQLPPEIIAQLRNMLAFWVARAKADGDPALYAELALDTIDPALLGAFILRDDLKELAADLNPDVVAHWQWIAEMVEEILRINEENILTASGGKADKAKGTEDAGAVSDPKGAPATNVYSPDNQAPGSADIDGNPKRKSGNGGDNGPVARPSAPGKARTTRKTKSV